MPCPSKLISHSKQCGARQADSLHSLDRVVSRPHCRRAARLDGLTRSLRIAPLASSPRLETKRQLNSADQLLLAPPTISPSTSVRRAVAAVPSKASPAQTAQGTRGGDRYRLSGLHRRRADDPS